MRAGTTSQYIDRVHPGLPADLYYDGYSSRTFQPMVSGQAVYLLRPLMRRFNSALMES